MTGRRFTEKALVIASHNQGKVNEIAALLAPYKIDVSSAAQLGLADVDETGDTFIANAILKAESVAKATGKPALADDSGLSVAALDGAPGIYSARWAGAEKDFNAAMLKVHIAMQASGNPDTSAKFVCALALAWPDGYTVSTEGVIQGHITWPPCGNKGFGYDPLFIPNGHTLTFAEMEPHDKHAMSHRALAFEKLLNLCF